MKSLIESSKSVRINIDNGVGAVLLRPPPRSREREKKEMNLENWAQVSKTRVLVQPGGDA